MNHPKEPTGDQCNHGERVEDFSLIDGVSYPAYAIWYPQMGGYCGKAVVVLSGESCFDVFVWHDGQFPFSERIVNCEGDYKDVGPVELHHCDASQFINFGGLVLQLQRKENDGAGKK